MKAFEGFSLSRWWSMVQKEFLQLRRDRVTFAMIVGLPLIQLALFGYAINTDPKRMPTAVVLADESDLTRSLVSAMEQSGYFRITDRPATEGEAAKLLAEGRVQFVLSVPPDFTREALRGGHPSALLEADASDPTATGNALAAAEGIVQAAAVRDLKGPYAGLAQGPPPYGLEVHRLYNPEGITQLNIVPGLMGVILTMTTVMMTGLAITRERERGTMENLLAMPVTPTEVMTGKIVPYIAIALLQSTLILLAAWIVFRVPFEGSLLAVYVSDLCFIAANLTVGITLSSLAQNQLQAVQLTFFFFLPNLMLSGFMFPFRGMPAWAQTLGSALPLTHFNRLIRGILLKGNGWAYLWPEI
ncbi:MAG TPA: ABC transporter permease, partial [Holophagaceae bacterium]|nr:ABC transporter permease [Holophagaceae bacterium]